MRRPSLLIVAWVLGSMLTAAVPAEAAVSPVNKTRFGGVAIEGYDAVAYFTQSEAVKGDKAHQFEWNGAKWRFASAEHLELFRAAPEKYAPKYGGYCAWAVSQGYTAGIDPEAFRIVDERLYLNYSKKVQQDWEQDIPGNIAEADKHWPKIVGETRR